MTDRIVRVVCQGESGVAFYIHEQLLRSNAPRLRFHYCPDYDKWEARINVRRHMFAAFTQWLYNRDAEAIKRHVDSDDLEELFSVRSYGEEFGNVDFMDAVLDLVIEFLGENHTFGIQELIYQLASELPVASTGREFALDYLVYKDKLYPEDKSRSMFQEVQEACESGPVLAFVNELAERILKAKDPEQAEDIDCSTFSNIVVSGYFDARVCGDYVKIDTYP